MAASGCLQNVFPGDYRDAYFAGALGGSPGYQSGKILGLSMALVERASKKTIAASRATPGYSG